MKDRSLLGLVFRFYASGKVSPTDVDFSWRYFLVLRRFVYTPHQLTLDLFVPDLERCPAKMRTPKSAPVVAHRGRQHVARLVVTADMPIWRPEPTLCCVLTKQSSLLLLFPIRTRAFAKVAYNGGQILGGPSDSGQFPVRFVKENEIRLTLGSTKVAFAWSPL